MLIKGTNITIPDSLIVEGDLNLRYNGVTELPFGLVVHGFLDLEDSGITELPEVLSVGSYLDLSNTCVTWLPAGLTVGGFFDLRNTGITELPEGLNVGGDIYSDKQLIACEKLQLELIKQSKEHFYILKDPTAAAIRLHDMLWVI